MFSESLLVCGLLHILRYLLVEETDFSIGACSAELGVTLMPANANLYIEMDSGCVKVTT